MKESEYRKKLVDKFEEEISAKNKQYSIDYYASLSGLLEAEFVYLMIHLYVYAPDLYDTLKKRYAEIYKLEFWENEDEAE